MDSCWSGSAAEKILNDATCSLSNLKDPSLRNRCKRNGDMGVAVKRLIQLPPDTAAFKYYDQIEILSIKLQLMKSGTFTNIRLCPCVNSFAHPIS